MGRVSVESETAFAHPPDRIYDFVSNPANWGRTYKGSCGVHQHLELPLKVGDAWTEKVNLPPNTYSTTWTLITAIRPRKWVFQQVNRVGMLEDGSGGVDGMVTISYTFETPGQGVTLFTRNLTIELPKGVGMPDDLLTVCCRPDGIDRYHAAVGKELDEQFGCGVEAQA
ncbi:hypothetical protein AUEXF2481DRAFT_552426 [Aureobasidium subglaciale EXF-2481]|uniref:Polyketide cyclase n=1 Tax=Aureobasidium subglaciale (strain EXF-2481) TaxID=1043005 RepID=A0A074YJ87_AURSE|nr:uncharacterized protein AUEXF2481DRAFT_552426 [Aureobasidium subglaciale EXF-2481]KEQ97883.1 hypothetical protein AUEXF2481DRAFT_552426 [Aureobasidium subglaciale EXF-2481]